MLSVAWQPPVIIITNIDRETQFWLAHNYINKWYTFTTFHSSFIPTHAHTVHKLQTMAIPSESNNAYYTMDYNFYFGIHKGQIIHYVTAISVILHCSNLNRTKIQSANGHLQEVWYSDLDWQQGCTVMVKVCPAYTIKLMHWMVSDVLERYSDKDV